jgi:type III restriction enzyme
MKLHFEDCYQDARLSYQQDAIDSVCELFAGQEICRTEFTVMSQSATKVEQQSELALGGSFVQTDLGLMQSELGIGNRLTLLDDEILGNLQNIQTQNGLRPTTLLSSGDFTVEMETGTGKTYVYLRTVFELNKRFGFTKFVIVVPSVAIKEGVYKTLQITEDHFRTLYANKPFEYFLYDSNKLGQVRNFATSPNIQVMVVTVGAINKKDVNNLYKDSEKTGGEKPIDLIRATRPIIIVDEPQSVDGGLEGQGKKALGEMNPLCTLRYSATHVDKHHMVYRLDAVDAYERKLVKQIEVASADVDGGHNKPYIRLISIKKNRAGAVLGAELELDVQRGATVQRDKVVVEAGENDLEQITKRPLYAGYLIEDFGIKGGEEFLQLSNIEAPILKGEAIGGVDEDAVKRQMIRRTIEEHLEKELRLLPMGIKVLSLFFIDAVEHYRSYDENGAEIQGKYAKMFEEEYRKAAAKSTYRSLFKEIDLDVDVREIHNGYFSIDKKGKWTDTAENNQGNRENAERAYSLIMKDKEKLLSIDTKLKFIFSHSALKEGWDNPNVFQICALREIGTERERRQTIGRGLRLCVNQDGQRVRGEVNTLTVVATESYESFAENLQKEIEADTGIRFGVVEKHQFANIAVKGEDGKSKPLGIEQSESIWTFLKDSGYVDAKGKVQDTLRTAIKEGTVQLPAEFKDETPQVVEMLRKLAGKLEVRNADDKRPVRTRQAILNSPEFKALWDRIKFKTTYRVDFDNEKLIKTCTEAINDSPPVAKTRLQWRKADLAIGKGGVDAQQTSASAPIIIEEQDIVLPDLLTELQDRTHLTRKSLVKILTDSHRLGDFKKNPQQFIDQAAEAINQTKRMALVDGIRYRRIGDDAYYAQELFEKEELFGYLHKNMLEAKKSVYEYVVYDSGGVEKSFAEQLDMNEAVKLFAKLPGWFKVPTPLGTYNPDWAVLVEEDGKEKLYFVVETKGSLFKGDLRNKEGAKIACGTAHFEVLAEYAVEQATKPANYIVTRNIDDLMKHI